MRIRMWPPASDITLLGSILSDLLFRWLDNALNDRAVQAGGYFVNQYCERAVFEAFAGVGWFIEDDMGAVDEGTPPEDIPMADAIVV